jgi:pilus assembly protein CpaD
MKKIVATLLTLSLGACAPVFNGEQHALTPTDRFPITVDADTATLEVRPSLSNGRLNSLDRVQIRNFVSEYKQRGHGPMRMASDGGGRSATLANVKSVLTGAGLSSAQIEDTSYSAKAASASASVILSFTRYIANVSECGIWDKNMGYTQRNLPWPNFGCATQSNLAAMVVDPHDLTAPRGKGKTNADRRSVVLEKYREGDISSSDRSEAESGAISGALD